MILVYSAMQNPRLDYVAALLGKEYFGEPLRITSDAGFFKSSESPKVQYGGDRFEQTTFYVPAASLLSERGVRPHSIHISFSGQLPVMFSGEGDLPFDIFAAVFYLLSRYEEWLPFSADEYGRFPPEASLAFQNGFLDRPLIDEWLGLFRKKLTAVFPGLSFREKKFSLLPTYDIDMAWSYRGKSWLRACGGLIRDLAGRDFGGIKDRAAVLTGSAADPFDNFQWLDDLHRRLNLNPVYFLLLSLKPGRLDKNIPPRHAGMQRLIKSIASKYRTGIHPSWQSGDDELLLKAEAAELSAVTGKEVQDSRQHYLRLSMPVTYRRLLDAGILCDYSMGYGSLNGFRASYTGSFYWYDLEKEQETRLLLTPFCFMDATAFHRPGASPDSALKEMQTLAGKIVAVQGRMVTLWHNHYLGTTPAYSGWRKAYEQFVIETSGW